ncbi:hypothetical protein MBANPS3_008172 [Mucor bainieri]
MKLRDRGKRVIGNIKQEDQKPALTMADSLAFIPTDTSNVNITVKQEDTKEDKQLLQPNSEFGKDCYHRCDICEMKLANLKSVLEHRTSIHHVGNHYNYTRIKHTDIEPNIHDPNFYCKGCERSYKDIGVYRQHLRQVHYMAFKPILRWSAPRNDLVPDPDDPDLYCKACDRSYKRKQTYTAHCRYKHGMKSIKFANQSSESSNTTDSYCQVCDRRLSNMNSYRQHLFAIHKVDSRPLQRKQKDILPDVNDLNFYCRSCEKKFTSKRCFRHHLKLVHSIFPSAPRKNSRLKPNVNDPNNYCRACQKTYSTRGTYRTHLLLVHQMTYPTLKGNANRTDLPDPYDPDHHCSVCKKTYASSAAYRKHCKSVHSMTLNHASIVNPDAQINIDDPNSYCAQCELSHKKPNDFRKHLRRVHGKTY